ncbi:MAG: LysR family transcriptional regulator, partial [Pseudomonadota bacterium]
MKTSKLSLKWLDAFLLTARTGAVQDAAEEAGLSVSTVSHHLRSLEDTLGVTLFDHTRRPMRLTSAGAVFYSHVDKAMRILRRAEMEAQSGDLIDTRAMSLAMVEDFDSEIGPELARALAAGMPKCQFRHLTRPSHEILDMIRDQEVDVGIAARPQFMSENIQELPLLKEPFVLVLPSEAKDAPEAFLSNTPPLPLLRYSSNQIIATQIEQ